MKNILTLILAICIANCISAQSLEQARRELHDENYMKARVTLLTLYKTNQTSVIPLYIGNTYMMMEDTDSAKIYYQMAESGADAYAFLAKARLAGMNKLDKALIKAHIDKAISLSRKRDAEVFLQAGLLTWQPTATAPADYVAFLEEAHRLAPDNDYYTLVLGDIYREIREGGKAMSKYEEVIERNPRNAMALMRKGSLSYSSMNYTNAIEFMEKANAINASYSIVHKELGELYYLTKQYEKASMAFKKYLELNNNDSRAKATYGGFLFQLKEYQKAVDEITPFSNADTTNAIFYRIIAYSNFEIKEMQNAKLAMDKLWKYIEPGKVISLDYIYAGKIAAAIGDTAGAINYLKSAVSMDTLSTELQSEYAKALFNSKRNSEAIIALNRRLTMAEKGPSPLDYYYLGRAYYNNSEYVNADSAFAQFVKMQPNTPDGYLWRAKSNLELEDKSNLKGFASVHYLKYIEIASSDIVRNKANLISAYNYLGFVALSQNDNVKAKENFSKILEIDPGNTRAQEEVKRLK